MRPAAELNVLSGRLTTLRIRHEVMELEPAALNTAARRADERALSRVTLRDVALHRSRNVPTPTGRGRRPPRSCRRRESHNSFTRSITQYAWRSPKILSSIARQSGFPDAHAKGSRHRKEPFAK